MKEQIPSFLLIPENRTPDTDKRKYSLPFIDNTIKNAAAFIKTCYAQSETWSANGLFQRIDPRIVFLFLLWYIVLINLIHNIRAQLCISLFLLLLSFVSQLNVFRIYGRIVAISFFFGLLVIAPASLNVINDGEIILPLFHFQKDYQIGMYYIPLEIGVTREGIIVITRLYLKILNSVTLSLLVLNTTAFHKLIKAMKMLKVPDLLLLILTMTYKFIFIMAHTTLETYFGLKLRWLKKGKHADVNRIIAGRIGYIFRKSWHRYEEVFQAMVARGFTGSIDFYFTEKIRWRDIIFLSVSISIGLLIFLIR